MKNFPLVMALAIFSSASALAEVKTCSIKKIVIKDGKETVTPCTWKVDSEDDSEKDAPGSIIRTEAAYLGTASSDCGIPGPEAYGLYDQGNQSVEEAKGYVDYLQARYEKHGKIGIDPEKIASSKWYAGGEGAVLNYVYEFWDKEGNSLGMLFYGPGNPFLEFEGCFTE